MKDSISFRPKMMLAEYYEPDFYKELPNHLDSEGKWDEVPEILADIKTMVEDKKRCTKNNGKMNRFPLSLHLEMQKFSR